MSLREYPSSLDHHELETVFDLIYRCEPPAPIESVSISAWNQPRNTVPLPDGLRRVLVKVIRELISGKDLPEILVLSKEERTSFSEGEWPRDWIASHQLPEEEDEEWLLPVTPIP